MNLPLVVKMTFLAIIQPAIVQEKFHGQQPIPFMLFRLCCPPGMIPLTCKVAQRLGINMKSISPAPKHGIST